MSIATQLRENDGKRGVASTRMREILHTAETAKRSLTSEEREKYDRAEADYDELTAANAKLRSELDSMSAGRRAIGADKPHTRGPDASGEEGGPFEFKDSTRAALKDYFLTGNRAGLQVDVDDHGGTLVADEQFVAEVIKAVDDQLVIRQLATVIQIGAGTSLAAPTWDTDPADADWTNELSAGSEDTAARTGKRKLEPQPIGKHIKISDTLARARNFDVVGFVGERLAYKLAITEEKGFLTGTGAHQPLGVFTASALGIDTSRDVSTSNTATEVKADGLISAFYALKAPYLQDPSCRWIFHRTVVRDIRKLKDGNGQYLWTMGLEGASDRILGIPTIMSEYAPNTMTSGLYVGIIGAFKHFWIADALTVRLQRLNELFALTDQIGIVGRAEVDGAPVVAEAFSRVQLG